jgi:hypothetical protein
MTRNGTFVSGENSENYYVMLRKENKKWLSRRARITVNPVRCLDGTARTKSNEFDSVRRLQRGKSILQNALFVRSIAVHGNAISTFLEINWLRNVSYYLLPCSNQQIRVGSIPLKIDICCKK